MTVEERSLFSKQTATAKIPSSSEMTLIRAMGSTYTFSPFPLGASSDESGREMVIASSLGFSDE